MDEFARDWLAAPPKNDLRARVIVTADPSRVANDDRGVFFVIDGQSILDTTQSVTSSSHVKVTACTVKGRADPSAVVVTDATEFVDTHVRHGVWRDTKPTQWCPARHHLSLIHI